jgi:hypothetical protein
VNARVTDRVICVFHAPVTLTTVAKTIETVDSPQNFHSRHSPLLLKRLGKQEKSERNFPHDLQETVASAFMVETPSSALYLLGNIQTGKSKKKLRPVGGVPGWKQNLGHSPLLM